MARYKPPAPPKDPQLVEAEQAAQEALRRYFRRELGMQAMVARESGIPPAALSRMANHGERISLEYALRIDVVTQGELRAEALCPSRAPLLNKFLVSREAAKES